MKTRNKALLLIACALLLVATSVFGTVAYLTAKDTVVNTFTVGNVQISLDEAKVNEYGQELDDQGNVYTGVADQVIADRVEENTYKLLPGHTYVKDPIVHVDDDSEDCWLFVKVKNQITAIEAETTTEEPTYTNIADQMAVNGWKPVAEESDIYAYKAIVSGGDDVVVFDEFKIAGTVDNDTLAAYAPQTTGEGEEAVTTYKNIIVTAYAVQADGFDTAELAWAAFVEQEK